WEATEPARRNRHHRVGAAAPDGRRRGSASRTAAATSPEPTPRSSTAPSPIRASRSRATRISCCSARVASPSLAPASPCRAVSLCCHTPKPYSAEAAALHAQPPVETRAPLTPDPNRHRLAVSSDDQTAPLPRLVRISGAPAFAVEDRHLPRVVAFAGAGLLRHSELDRNGSAGALGGDGTCGRVGFDCD